MDMSAARKLAPVRRCYPAGCLLGWVCRYFSVETSDAILRQVLEALCERDGLSLDSAAAPDEPARNYELAERLGIGHIFGLHRARLQRERRVAAVHRGPRRA